MFLIDQTMTTMSPPSLPTPAPSTEIPPGKRASFSTIDNTFSLPPAAIANPASKQNSSASSTSSVASAASDSSYRPISPLQAGSTQQSGQRTDKTPRRKSSNANNQMSNAARLSGGYTLPPPPTRSRKIIQMKPRTQNDAQSSSATTSPVFTGKTQPSPSLTGQTTPKASASSTPTASQQGTASAGTKRKQPTGPTTAAGRKIARKTAHSLIERRRRSKMNEEFGVLKDMIPACAGQDMHKLQVLSASIEYMRYLEKCLAELKAAHARCAPSHAHAPSASPFQHSSSALGTSRAPSAILDDDDATSASSDDPMADAPPPPPHPAAYPLPAPTYTHSHSLSPAIPASPHTTTPFAPTPLDAGFSPAISSSQIRAAHAPFTPSFGGAALPSPAFGSAGAALPSALELGAPALRGGVDGVERDDREATAALLMLNSDRRAWAGGAGRGRGGAGGRGMSVRDLLSG